MSTGGIARTYNAGVLSDETLLHASQAMTKLAASVSAELMKQREPLVEAVELIFNDLVKAITRLGHGGIVLFVDKQNDGYFSSCRRSAG